MKTAVAMLMATMIVNPTQQANTMDEHKRDFISFDTNQDGFIDAGEIRTKNENLSQDDIVSFFMNTDKNEDGRISLQEYLET